MEKKPNASHSHTATTNNVKLLCSYGGKIQSRPSDRHHLSYIGGDTKILAVGRRVTFSEIAAKLGSLCSRSIDGPDCSVKYQLPGEDLDALVSLIDDEDVEHMMVEYDRAQRIAAGGRPRRIRLFVFDITGAPNAKPGRSPNPDYLFGFDEEYKPSKDSPPLDLLQVLPENNCGGEGKRAISGSGCGGYNVDALAAVYRVPDGGMYRTGGYVYGMVGGGNREQPVMPQHTEQNLKVKVNQRNF